MTTVLAAYARRICETHLQDASATRLCTDGRTDGLRPEAHAGRIKISPAVTRGRACLEAEIHARITAAGLWGDPRWQAITDWNNRAYAKDQP